MNLPNKLTIARMFAVLIIIIVSLIQPLRDVVLFASVTLEDIILLVIFIAASFTDYLDGHIARKNNLVTNFGKFMDPLADKLLVLSTLIILLERGKFVVFGFGFGFAITIILAREFAVTGIRLIAVSNKVVIAASKLGKFKTVTQMLMIIVLLLDCYPFALLGGVSKDVTALILIVLATTMTLISGIDYFIKNKHVLKENTDN